MSQHLFAYGTLAPGRANEHVLADIEGTWEPASIIGELVQVGWGYEHGYPALSLDGTDTVPGMIFTSDDLDEHWARIDEFEGIGYQRVGAVAVRADGTSVDVQVYVDNPTIHSE